MGNLDELNKENEVNEVEMAPAPIDDGPVPCVQADSQPNQDANLRKKILGACTAAVVILAAIFVAIGISLFVLVPKASALLDAATTTIEEVQDSYDTIIATVKDIDATVQGINKIDFDEFSEAVNNLTSVINKIGNIFK